MAPIRLRHPKGVSTVEVALDDAEFTVLDLQQEIYAVTDILPARQLLRTGYPTRSLTLIPELPVSSLGLQRGDQIIVNEASVPLPTHGASSIPVLPASSQSGLVSHPPVKAPTSSGPEFVEVDGSYLIHRVVPDDNSCLFSSVALAFEQNIAKAPLIRQIVAEGIQHNSDIYNEAILGMPPHKYVDTITKPNSWGGAIELTVLAAHYNTEITSIDVESGRIDHYTPPSHDSGIIPTSTKTRCILIYSGIHYDAVSLAPSADAPGEWHQTIFEIRSTEDSSDPVLIAAKKLADILRSKKAFTNTATFDLKCEQCGQGLKGEKEARTHAEQTGHVRFGEY